MKFSVLLPTRNRLKYLRYAIDSVLAQDYDNWEIIVSDNNSHENIQQYIESLKDSRIKYLRTDRFISVTENWNNALNNCNGDYVIMLGDDDILLKRYFTTMSYYLDQFKNPDIIYSNAYIYTYPEVIPQSPQGSLHSCKHYPVFHNAKEPFWLTRKMSLDLVQGHLKFKAIFGTNMQYILFNQSMIDKVKVNNQFFHSPYPDVYAMNVLLLETEKILIIPQELVTIGVTPKSTGNFLINNEEQKGMEHLNISKELSSASSLDSVILPGSPSLTSWLISMEAVKLYFRDKFELKVNYSRYRLLQIEYMIKNFFCKKTSMKKKEILHLLKKIELKEKLTLFLPLFFLHLTKKLFPSFIKRPFVQIYNKIFSLSSIEGDGSIPKSFSNISEIFEFHENGTFFSKDQVRTILEESNSGIDIELLCQAYGITRFSFDRWKAKFDSNNIKV